MTFKKLIAVCILIIPVLSASQNQKQIDFYKSKFYEYYSIGIDSALFYNEKVFVSKKPIDLAFANAAKWQLLLVNNQKYDESKFLKDILFYLNQVPKTKNNYHDLAAIYNIVGNTYYKKFKYSKGLDYFLEAEKYALLNGNINQILKIKGNIASIKGDLNLVDEAIKDIKSILVLINANAKEIQKEKLEELNTRNKLNLGTFYITKYKMTLEKSYSDSASVILNQLIKGKVDDFSKAKSYSKLGVLNTELKKYALANQFYTKSIDLFYKTEQINEVVLNKYNLGFNRFQEKNYKEAKLNFLDVIRERKDTIIDFNYLFAHKYLASIYTIKKEDSAFYYMDRFTELYSKKTEREKLELAKSYNEIEKKDLNTEILNLKNRINYSSRLKNILFSAIAILGAILIFFVVKHYKNKKEAEIKLNNLLEKIIENSREKSKPFSKLKITNENEQKIIDGLEKLEKEKYFLKKEFNLHNVAKKIGSNTTYLTSVIKTYKEMSFNDYTNELRINYILNQLLIDKKLQNYTIQSLAEQIGYKKGASFSKIFKQKTGVTPFQYIEKLKSNS